MKTLKNYVVSLYNVVACDENHCWYPVKSKHGKISWKDLSEIDEKDIVCFTNKKEAKKAVTSGEVVLPSEATEYEINKISPHYNEDGKVTYEFFIDGHERFTKPVQKYFNFGTK